jgi:hypothetical protein
MRRFSLSLCVCLAAGCSSAAEDELIPLEKVPETFVNTAKQTLPEVTFDQALKRSDGSYEVRGKDKTGKVRDVEFSATGEIIEVE